LSSRIAFLISGILFGRCRAADRKGRPCVAERYAFRAQGAEILFAARLLAKLQSFLSTGCRKRENRPVIDA
jgi:hypothetical protein